MSIPLTDQARVLVMAIAGQESGWSARLQVGGPARGFWQFEKLGGVVEVMAKCPHQLSGVCANLDILFDRDEIHLAMAWNDTLACSMARLLLWPDPAPLPALGEEEAAWQYYLRNWRPGAPHRGTWSTVYPQSLALVRQK